MSATTTDVVFLTGPIETNVESESGLTLPNVPRSPHGGGSYPALAAETRFRHSGWRVRRRKVWDALNAMLVSDSALERFAECGNSLRLEITADGSDVRVVSSNCRNRWCEACGRDRAATVAANVAALIVDTDARFVTLTRRAASTPLADQLDSLLECFNRLRERAFWKDNVVGGAAFIECKIGKNSGLWHLHIHMVLETPWLDQKRLSEEWHCVTNDSFIVDVRPIRDAGDNARYVAKYATKPADASVYESQDKLTELMTAFRGRRLCMTFGKWRGKKLAEAEADGRAWKALGSVANVAEGYSLGWRDESRAWNMAIIKWPSLAYLFPVPNVGPSPPVSECPF